MSTPDLTSYRLVHKAIRRGTADVAAAVQDITEPERHVRGRHLARWFAGFSGELHVHHTVEDVFFFPALFERVPALRGHLERTDDEHHHLDDTIAATRAAIAAFADPAVSFGDAVAVASERTGDLDGLMDRHLDFEDAEILPLFTRHMDGDDYDRVEKAAMSSPDLGQLKFTVPWLLANADVEEQRHLLDGAPFMMKVLWAATRRSHARLTSAALGAAAPAPTVAVAS